MQANIYKGVFIHMVIKKIPQEFVHMVIAELENEGLKIISIKVDPANFMNLFITAAPAV